MYFRILFTVEMIVWLLLLGISPPPLPLRDTHVALVS